MTECWGRGLPILLKYMEFSLICFTNTSFPRYLKVEGAHETFHKPKWLKSEEAIILMQNKSR